MTSVSASIHSTMSLTNLVEQLSVIGIGLVGVRAAKPPPQHIGYIWKLSGDGESDILSFLPKNFSTFDGV